MKEADSTSGQAQGPEEVPGRQDAIETMDGIRDALYELLGKDFAHITLIAVQPMPSVEDKIPDPHAVSVSVRHLSFGGINPDVAHMLSIKRLIDYGAEHFSNDADPDLISQIFGTKLRIKGRGKGRGGSGSGGKILRP